MKKKILTGLWFPVLALLASCEFDHPEAVIYPDPVFGQSGLQQFATNAIYEDYIVEVPITRTCGLSQEVTLNLSVDAAVLDEYNEQYGAAYTLLGSDYYTLPASVTIPATVKEILVPVTIHPSELVDALGLEKANRTILPVRISGSSVLTEESGTLGRVLLAPVVSKPEIDAVVPATTPELSFISTIPLTQDIVLTTLANFTTLDVSKVSYAPVMDKVQEYNTANQTNYLPLPENTFTIKEDVFDSETLEMKSTITFDCAKLGGINDYLLPVELTQKGTEYNIGQSGPIYIIVRLTELKVKANDGGKVVTTATGKGELIVNINTPIPNEMSVNMTYDASQIAIYNENNGTTYKELDASKIKVTPSVISAGSMSGSVTYEIDILDLPYDADKYLVPLKIDASALASGTVVEEPSTVYVEVNKTLAGDYFSEAWTPLVPGTEDWSSRNVPTTRIYLSGENGKSSQNGMKYYFVYGGVTQWADGIMFFDISDEPMPNHENCVKLINFQDREQLNESTGQYVGYDSILNNSYLNLVTGEVVIDCIIQGYWAPAPTNESQTKGYQCCVKLSR